LTERTIMGRRSLHNSAISENRCIFWTMTSIFWTTDGGDLCFGIQ
jgi:hypothetical protein